MKRLISFILAALTVPAFAGIGTAQISLTPPTAYSDGTPLPLTSISAYPIVCTFKPTGSTTKGPCVGLTPAELPGAGTTSAVTFTYPAQGGEACFSLRTRVGAAISNPPSNESCRTFAPLAPNSPTNVTVTITVAVDP